MEKKKTHKGTNPGDCFYETYSLKSTKKCGMSIQ